MEISKHIKDKLSLLPHAPGSYQMKNKDGVIIYVGKAKDLNNRVKSYFTGRVTGKTRMLVNDIVDFDYIVTESELESLILEINLIKKYDPKYNILLRDDKSYPYIELTNDKYPSVRIVRNINRKKNKSHLFGPYPNVKAAKDTVDIIGRMYPLRKCANMKKSVCLYYHIGECLGYCEKHISDETVAKMKEEIIAFLKGDASIVTKKIEEEMFKASEAMNFEKAIELKTMLENINITLRKQKIDLAKTSDLDMFGFYKSDNYLTVTVFFIRGGLLFGTHKETFTVVDNEELEEYIIKFYEKNHLMPKEIVIQDESYKELLEDYLNVKVTIPKRGELKKLLDMCIDNSRIKLEEEEEILKKKDDNRLKAIDTLKELLKIDKVSRIESFDNSHLFGTFYVGGMVVFDDFIPNKDLYRKFKVDVNVKDDLSAMREVIYRRYFKVLMENEEKPDLVVVDGGREQVRVAKEVIDSLNLDIRVIGLKKDDKHRTNSIIDSDLSEISLNDKREVYVYLSKIQEEVHRYAISYHRNIKSKGMLSSILDFVPSIGPKKRKALLKEFPSLKKMREASIEELSKIVGKSSAEVLYMYLKNEV